MSRKTITLEVDNQAQEELIRRYHALVQEMSDLARSAPDGRVLDMLEEVAVEKGRDTLRATLEQAVQQRIDASEKKGL
jgi:phage terminase Nu1 subunit (DNA packaging protein)